MNLSPQISKPLSWTTKCWLSRITSNEESDSLADKFLLLFGYAGSPHVV